MSDIPFTDLLAEIERDPKETALTLMEAIKVGECSMADVLSALREAASQTKRAANRVVVEQQIVAIVNGVRFVDPAAYDAWVVENGPVLRASSVAFVTEFPDRLQDAPAHGSSLSSGRSANSDETLSGAFKKVAWAGGLAGIAMIGILLALGENSIFGLSLMGIGTAFTVGYLAMYHFFGYSNSNRR